jgi:hypothetical protein
MRRSFGRGGEEAVLNQGGGKFQNFIFARDSSETELTPVRP